MLKNFNAENETKGIIKSIQDYFESQPNAKGAIIGISGGKDSTIVAKLLVEALGKDRVFGVLMPNGYQNDIIDSHRVVDNLQIDFRVVNINGAYLSMLDDINYGYNFELSKQAKINIAPRIRMTILYAMAATLHYRVCGTSNRSEIYIGYTTKWGDSACDFNPIANYTKEEVVAIGKYLGLPDDLINKAPSDGLSNKTDEDSFGFSYEQLNSYIKTGTSGNKEIDEKIKLRHKYNQHKFHMPIQF